MGQFKLPVSIKAGPYEPSVLVRFRPAWSYLEGIIREFGRFFCVTTFMVTCVGNNSSAGRLANLPSQLERIRPPKSTYTVRPWQNINWYGGLCIEPTIKEQ